MIRTWSRDDFVDFRKRSLQTRAAQRRWGGIANAALLLQLLLLAAAPSTATAEELPSEATPTLPLVFLPGTASPLADPPAPIAEQVAAVLKTLDSGLAATGLDRTRVVSADGFLTDLRQFPTAWAELAKGLAGGVPAAAVVEAGLPESGQAFAIATWAAPAGVAISQVQPEGWPGAPGRTYGTLAGDVLFVSGMAAFDPATGSFTAGDLAAQVRRTMDNVRGVVEAAGLAWSDLVRCRVFLPDARDYAAMNEVYATMVPSPPPVRSTVEARLLRTDARFGAQCVAARDPERKVFAPGDDLPPRPFSPAIAAGGMLWVAGIVGRSGDGYPAGPAAQTRVALERVGDALRAAGIGWDEVVAATVFLADPRWAQAVAGAFGETLATVAPPTFTVATPLASPEALVEVEVTARLPR